MRAVMTYVLWCVLCAATLGACAWGDQTGIEGPDPVLPAPVCGDGLCAGPEVGRCPSDCGNPPAARCGNGTCDAGETSASCAADCPAQSQCGNGTCDAGETTGNCAADCPAPSNCPSNPFSCVTCANWGVLCPSGHDQNTCTTCIINAGGGGCAGGFPDGACDAGEDMTSCPFDCM